MRPLATAPTSLNSDSVSCFSTQVPSLLNASPHHSPEHFLDFTSQVVQSSPDIMTRHLSGMTACEDEEEDLQNGKEDFQEMADPKKNLLDKGRTRGVDQGASGASMDAPGDCKWCRTANCQEKWRQKCENLSPRH